MKVKKIPTRKCVACQEMRPKKELIRVVRTPELGIDIDLIGKKSGRGAYLCFSNDCLQTAKKRKSLDRALEVSIGDDTFEKIKIEIEKYHESRK